MRVSRAELMRGHRLGVVGLAEEPFFGRVLRGGGRGSTDSIVVWPCFL